MLSGPKEEEPGVRHHPAILGDFKVKLYPSELRSLHHLPAEGLTPNITHYRDARVQDVIAYLTHLTQQHHISEASELLCGAFFDSCADIIGDYVFRPFNQSYYCRS